MTRRPGLARRFAAWFVELLAFAAVLLAIAWILDTAGLLS